MFYDFHVFEWPNVPTLGTHGQWFKMNSKKGVLFLSKKKKRKEQNWLLMVEKY